MAKRFLSFIAAAILVVGILYVARADVNHGHGPGHGEETTEETAGGH